MVFRAKLLANRRNARKSTGPKSEEGKRASAQNATTHGMYAGVVALGESAEMFQEMRSRVIEGYKPQDHTELAIVEEIAVAQWKLRRLRETESAWLDALSERLVEESGKFDEVGLEVMLISQMNLIKDGSAELIGRMEVRLQNSVSRAIRQLEKVRKLRGEASELPASPVELRAPIEQKIEAEVVAEVGVNQMCETKPNELLESQAHGLETRDTGGGELSTTGVSPVSLDHGRDARGTEDGQVSLEMLTYSRVTGFQPVSLPPELKGPVNWEDRPMTDLPEDGVLRDDGESTENRIL